MKKIVLSALVIIVLLALLFIPVTNEKTVSIKSTFLKVHDQLADPMNWEKWRSDLKPVFLTDSASVAIQKNSDGFNITAPTVTLSVKSTVNLFNVAEKNNAHAYQYSYSILPDINPGLTVATVSKNTSVAGYLAALFGSDGFKSTHIDDLKNFLETDSLLYGRPITKIRVPGDNLITIRKTVIKKDKFTEALKMLEDLNRFIKVNNARKIQPLIAQFLPVGKDSAQVNVGFFIDKELKNTGDVTFVRMPGRGRLLAVKYKGIFSKRQVAYDEVQQYFTDHMLQPGVLPFETYLDDKLPTSDADIVNIQINFTTFL